MYSLFYDSVELYFVYVRVVQLNTCFARDAHYTVFRTTSEEQQSDSVRKVESTNSSLVIEIDRIRVQLAEQCAYAESINAQVIELRCLFPNGS